MFDIKSHRRADHWLGGGFDSRKNPCVEGVPPGVPSTVGKVKPLAVTGLKRYSLTPQVPTIVTLRSVPHVRAPPAVRESKARHRSTL